jgi:hypothetical protein
MIEVVTKSGTNQFHGSAFEFVRNDILNADDWFLNRAGQPKAPTKHNDFGFTLGGPVYIPGVYNTNKQKTFFFSRSNGAPSRRRDFEREGAIVARAPG